MGSRSSGVLTGIRTLAWVLLMALLPIAPAHALRCGRQLVQVGDHKLDVLDRCGDPDSVSERRAVRGGRFRHSTGVVQLERFDEITIEEWIYNFGPRRFKQQLYFEDGILTQIRDLGYGH